MLMRPPTDPASFSLAFPCAWGGPAGTANFRTRPEDFVVEEDLGFEPAGSGEHLFLHLKKRNHNTRWVAGQLAALVGIDIADVGYCGMKDRRAVTSQWFSLHLPKQDLSLSQLSAIAGVELIDSGRHPRKLRRGDHKANRFVIRLRCCGVAETELKRRLQRITLAGVPNYYGEQRFGHDCNNLVEFERIYVNSVRGKGNRLRRRGNHGLYLSAGRSWVFNRILSARVEQGTWNKPLAGEQSPEGALWGRGRSIATAAVQDLENHIIGDMPGWRDALEHSGLGQERRPLVLVPGDFDWQLEGGDVVLGFSLSPGQFATSVLRELFILATPEAAHGIVCASDNI